MAKPILNRNIRARELLELFFLAAVSSLLAVRFYLHITGYPQVGTGSLHIAHMLWGGALMLVAMTLTMAFLGRRVQTVAALVGGTGFGIFIDELGKFITRDNNYFYEPTIGILYAVFVVIYLAFNFLSRRQKLSDREYHLNALAQLEDAVLLDMDPAEKARVRALLDQTDQTSDLTRRLRRFLDGVRPVAPPAPNTFSRLQAAADGKYRRFWQARRSNMIVQLFFVLETILFLAGVAYVAFTNFDNVLDLFAGQRSHSAVLLIGELLSAGAAAGFALVGVYRLTRSRLDAFEYFRRATLVNILLTEFFIFSREQFGALPGFAFNLLLLALINFVARQERRQG